MPFDLTSPTITQGAQVPVEHTCDGADLAPLLAWSGAPDGTAELLLLFDDPDAGDFVHWLVAGIPAGTEGLDRGSLPAGAHELTNGFGRQGYGGPCPPSGTHRYVFSLFALSSPIAIADGANAAQVRGALSGVLLGTAVLEARYTRQR